MQTILLFILPLFVSCQVRIYRCLMCCRICCHLLGLALCQKKSNRRLLRNKGVERVKVQNALGPLCICNFLLIFVGKSMMNLICTNLVDCKNMNYPFCQVWDPAAQNWQSNNKVSKLEETFQAKDFFRCWSPPSKTGRSLTHLTERLIFPVSALTSMM